LKINILKNLLLQYPHQSAKRDSHSTRDEGLGQIPNSNKKKLPFKPNLRFESNL